MRIGIDAHGIGGHSLAAGNEIFVLNLIKQLARLDSCNEYEIYVNYPQALAQHLAGVPNFRTCHLWPPSQWIQRPVSLPLHLLRHPVDVLHVPSIVPPLCPAPTVVTIHDLLFESHPEHYTPLELMRMRAFMRLSAWRAARIITVSHFSKHEIVARYGIPADKVIVTPGGVDLDVFTPVADQEHLRAIRTRYGTSDRFILYVGTIQPRKNLVRLVKAFGMLKAGEEVPHKLVMAGKPGWMYDDVYATVHELGLQEEVIFTGYVPDADLPALYSAAELFVYPSLCEGLGRPVLEAMACGTPALASNTSAFPEVLGDAAVLVDPTKVEEIARGMRELLFHPELRAQFRGLGFERVRQFTWEEMARRILRVYEEVAVATLPAEIYKGVGNT